MFVQYLYICICFDDIFGHIAAVILGLAVGKWFYQTFFIICADGTQYKTLTLI